MKQRKLTLSLAALMALAPVSLAGQDTPSCSDDKSRQFDFWIGEWEVEAGGELAGTNSIKPIVDGCVLHENWRGAKGSAGTSLNFYNPRKEKWQQFWVWRNGTTLELEGSFEDGKMVLSGESVSREGKRVQNRITWYDNPDGTVRQHWEYSADSGSSWETAFDGIYRKKKEKRP